MKHHRPIGLAAEHLHLRRNTVVVDDKMRCRLWKCHGYRALTSAVTHIGADEIVLGVFAMML